MMPDNPESSTTSTSISNEITKETSARICTHMNEDHYVSVYAMAKSLLTPSNNNINNTKLSNVKLVKVTLEGCQITAVSCQGDSCEMLKLFYNFQPPLRNSAQVRPAMVEIHHKVCAPQLSWFITRIDVFIVFVVVALLGYITHVVGTDHFTKILQDFTYLQGRTWIAEHLSMAVKYSWYFALVVHFLEALYVVYQAQITLKLQVIPTTLLWFFMVGCVGIPVTKEFLDLLRVHHHHKNDKDKGVKKERLE
jgi:Protein of unknown function (DUF2470)